MLGMFYIPHDAILLSQVRNYTLSCMRCQISLFYLHNNIRHFTQLQHMLSGVKAANRLLCNRVYSAGAICSTPADFTMLPLSYDLLHPSNRVRFG